MLKFIVDANVGKLVGWLRMMGFDTVFFTGEDDSAMVRQALAEERVLLTRDTAIMKRRVVNSGRLKAVLFTTEDHEQQMAHLLAEFDLHAQVHPFTRCLEDNQSLIARSPEEVKDRVPPYVFKTQEQYMECPLCHRVYWRGTHWAAMQRKLEKIAKK
jgi:uncharacterized protein with PIN domain